MDNTPAQTTDNAPRSLRHLSVYLATLVKGRLWLKVLIGMGLGLVVGTLLGPSVGLVEPETGTLIGNWLAFPGQLFLATIQMIVIPLVIASVVRGLAASDNLEQLRKMGTRVTLFFVITTAIAATIGLWVGGLVNPGGSDDRADHTASRCRAGGRRHPRPGRPPPDTDWTSAR